MSTTETSRPSTDRPTATFPTADHLARLEHEEAAHRERLADLWADRTPTELLPVVGRPAPSRRERTASAAGAAGAAGTAFPRVSTHRKPTRGRVARRTAPTGTKGLRRQSRLRRHLRAALAAPALAAAILIPMQLFAAQGIADARQASLQSARAGTGARVYSTPSRTEGGDQPPMSGQTATMSDRASAAQSNVRSDIQADWITEDTGAPFDRTNPAASPLLDLPRCTTSPDTPLPCLATVSPDSSRAVVLEEDASLTALVRR